ncbi:hypothetical protein NDU88_005153 [Pleurodeles waltl]|uniref:Uncharacterized protein n=1 Tax=Pleurodeles waltl TaxID=8319 RepID=A0AAV7LNG1_PLEWA|nr:hypothetical protein NDU88_005153 [Pleurodeles waltl]
MHQPFRASPCRLPLPMVRRRGPTRGLGVTLAPVQHWERGGNPTTYCNTCPVVGTQCRKGSDVLMGVDGRMSKKKDRAKE